VFSHPPPQGPSPCDRCPAVRPFPRRSPSLGRSPPVPPPSTSPKSFFFWSPAVAPCLLYIPPLALISLSRNSSFCDDWLYLLKTTSVVMPSLAILFHDRSFIRMDFSFPDWVEGLILPPRFPELIDPPFFSWSFPSRPPRVLFVPLSDKATLPIAGLEESGRFARRFFFIRSQEPSRASSPSYLYFYPPPATLCKPLSAP